MHLIPYTMGENKLSAAQIAKLLFKHIVRFFGVPKELVHVRDPRFTSHLWRELWHILGSKTSASTAFQTQSDGQSERTNCTFEQILHAHIHNKPPSAWLDEIPFTEFAINSKIFQSTGYSPFFMLYRQEVPLPLDYALANPSDGTMQPATTSLLTNIAQNTTAQLYTTNSPELAKTIQNYIQNAKKTNAKI